MAVTAIISELKTLLGVLLPPLKKKYFDQPKIYVSIRKPGGDSKNNLGLSMNNEIKTEIIEGKERTFIDGNNALRFFKIDRQFQLNLHNNSEHHAYNIKLIRPYLTHECAIQPAINYLQPLKQNEAESFTLTFSAIHQVTGEESVRIFNTPSDYFSKNKVIIEYRNVRGTKFYTEFDQSKPEEERNIFKKKNPLN